MASWVQLSITALLASSAAAVPLAGHQHHQHSHAKRDGSFQIQVQNNCQASKSVGLFQITPAFDMVSRSGVTNLQPGGTTTIAAPYFDIGMRLSATADQGAAAQWKPQALFEFGYSSYGGNDGTAYNLSLMNGCPLDTGIAVRPSNPACESKSCSPGNCAANQGWTSPTQDSIGSPADTTCYYGPTNFVVTFCP